MCIEGRHIYTCIPYRDMYYPSPRSNQCAGAAGTKRCRLTCSQPQKVTLPCLPCLSVSRSSGRGKKGGLSAVLRAALRVSRSHCFALASYICRHIHLTSWIPKYTANCPTAVARPGRGCHRHRWMLSTPSCGRDEGRAGGRAARAA